MNQNICVHVAFKEHYFEGGKKMLDEDRIQCPQCHNGESP